MCKIFDGSFHDVLLRIFPMDNCGGRCGYREESRLFTSSDLIKTRETCLSKHFLFVLSLLAHLVLTFKLNHKSWISLGLTQENITVTFTGPFRNLKLHESDIKSFNTGSKLTVNGFNWGTHYNQSFGEEMLRSLNGSNSPQDYKIIFHEEFVSCFHHLMDLLENVWTCCFDSLYILPFWWP